jgi:two-component system, NtrC family, sensor histidine kinase PilS
MLANPVLLRAAAVLFCGVFAFLLGLLSVRLLKNRLTEESEISESGSGSPKTLPLTIYNTVIQQLKQQKHELVVQSQAELNRARTSESLSQAVLSNLSSGVLVFGANGLVKTSNPAAKAILGFASASGLSPEDVFRGATVRARRSVEGMAGSSDLAAEALSVAQEVHAVLREGSQRRQVEADYETPANEPRFLSITISAVPAVDGNLLGVACLISDLSELESIRRQEEMLGEISGEMALRLRTSLATISGYAQQLAENHDRGLAQQLARDIAQEAAELERNIGGFLITKQARKSAGAGGFSD